MVDIEFKPGDSYRSSGATITLDGGHDVFRFCVNLLDDQTEFHRAGRGVLVQLREHLTPERFDPMAKSLLGDDRYKRLSDCFERDAFCCACEQEIPRRAKRWPAGGHQSFCYRCNRIYAKDRAA